MENPFIPGILAYLVCGEIITKSETISFALATLGIGLVSMTEKHNKPHNNQSNDVS